MADREWYRQLFESIADAALVIDQETSRIIEANEGAADLFGHSHGELLELRDSDLSADTPPAPETRRTTGASWTIHVDRRLFRRKDDTTFPAEVCGRVFPLKDRVVRLEIVRDVAARERAEEGLRESDARLHRALAAARAGTWEWDLATGENAWSVELWTLYDLDRDAWTPSYEAWLASIHPDDRAVAAATVTEAAARGEAFYTEWRVATRDGSERWLGSHGSPEVDDTGAVVRYLGVVVDITGRKTADAGEHRERATLEAVLGSMSDAAFVANKDGTFADFNDGWVAFCRFADREECIESFSGYRDLFEVFSPAGDSVPVEQWAVPRALRGETGAEVDSVIRRTDTGESWVANYGFAPIFDEHGEISGAAVLAHDVTKRAKAEQALRDEATLYRSLFESMPQGIVCLGGDGAVVAANRAAEGMLGPALGGLRDGDTPDSGRLPVGQDGSPFPREEHPACIALATGAEVHGVVMGVCGPDDRRRRWITVDAVPLFQEGEDRPHQVLVTLAETTEGGRPAATSAAG